MVDATQACGWLPVDASRIDVLACSAYKWLCSPRGTAFMTVRPELARPAHAARRRLVRRRGPVRLLLRPAAAPGEGRPPLRPEPGLVPLGRRRPPRSTLLLDIGIEAIHEHDLRLANRFREGLGLPPGDSAIVSAELPEAEERLRGTRVMAAARAGLLRTSWHVYNTDDDVDELLALLNGLSNKRGSHERIASGGPWRHARMRRRPLQA